MANEDAIRNGIKDISLGDKQNHSPDQLLSNSEIDECEEAVTTDSEDYITEPLSVFRFGHLLTSTRSDVSSTTLTPILFRRDSDCNISQLSLNSVQIPIVGYEVMEERARFTVYKLRIEQKETGDCWYVFRRYTDFVRLCNRLKVSFPHVVQYLPRKRWLKNNFDPVFLEDRLAKLQNLVNAILSETSLLNTEQIQDFFCLNEPPSYSEATEESRAVFEALEETIYQLKQQIVEKENFIENMEDKMHTLSLENENLRKVINNSTMNCQKCQKDYENISKMIQQ